ncbi:MULTISPECIES: flagellar hook-associated protein FlgK [unclassified Sphingomonas]|uniref:flagellar hook-associated protein FlgK n=1 Tax=unclassified Sphingomonas TaxID=196159 RepID=UPI000929E31F|nr:MULTISPECIES: flagellar hook-associated protein FlgK [unclassified Sphingomonas]OJU16067.1 MAG: flagellar hook-associated protein FlgK [Sphingomonas sp. 66-10]
MADLLSIGASGVKTYQTALATVSENIANVGNGAYARRSTNVTELAPVQGVLSAAAAMTGYGSIATGINRASDMFKSAAVRDSGADLARTQAGTVWLNSIQSALTGSDLSTSLTNFFNAAQSVAADPASPTPRAAMLESATTVANAFTATGNALAQVTADMDASADQATASLTSLSAALAKVNDGLSRSAPNTAQAASLADQRDSLLDQMSAIVDVHVTLDAAGRATVTAGGSNGPTLVSGNDAASVTYVRNGSGAVSFAVQMGGNYSVLTPNGGALGGIADGAQRIADTRDQLNTLATNFVNGVNSVQAQGRDLNNNAGQPLFSVGAAPTDVSLTLADPSGIAAAAVGGGTRDNSNILALGTLRTSGGFETKVTTLVAANAAALQNRNAVAAAQSAIHDGAVSARDAVSGVDLDSEAVDLMRFQQAYSASSRVIQAARDTFQSILEIR